MQIQVQLMFMSKMEGGGGWGAGVSDLYHFAGARRAGSDISETADLEFSPTTNSTVPTKWCGKTKILLACR